MNVVLATMLKNEARIVRRMLESVKDHVNAFCILDTGSTDGTQQVVSDYAASVGMPYSIVEEPFIDFAQSRNALLDHARRLYPEADYFLLLDADHILHVDEGTLRSMDLGAFDSYLLELRGGLVYKMPYLVRSGTREGQPRFRYLSPTHEYITADGGFSQGDAPGVWLDHLEDGGNRHDKFQRDEELLEREYSLDPNNQRTVFYLAQTIESKDPERAKQLYRRRFDLGGWDEERYISLLRIAGLSNEVTDWFNAWSFRPSRWEAATGLVKRLHESGNATSGYLIGKLMVEEMPNPSTDMLFVEQATQTWGFYFEWGLAAFYAGHPHIAKDCWEKVLGMTDVPQFILEQAERNLAFC